MSRPVHFALAMTLICSSLVARAEEKRASPHEQATLTLSGKKVVIQYGRPYKKGRAIFGGLVPYGEVWRTGADEATTLSTETDLMIGSLRVPKGTYALFTIPTEKGWTLVINKIAKQWGAYSYSAKEDLGRAPMTTIVAAAPVEQFSIALEPAGEKKATLKIAWDKVASSVTITAP